jgi:hypothetical protein
MARDAITKRLKSTVLWTVDAQRLLGGADVGVIFEQADIELQDRVFELFGLDSKKPHDHEVLLWFLVHIIFGKGRVGAPEKWRKFGQRPSPHQLKTDVAAVNHGSTKKKSVRETCRILIEDKDKRFKERYANIGSEALRDMVRNIKNGKTLGR